MNWRTFGQATVKEGERFFLFVEKRIYFAFVEKEVMYIFASHARAMNSDRFLYRIKMEEFLLDYPHAMWAHIHLPESHNEANP